MNVVGQHGRHTKISFQMHITKGTGHRIKTTWAKKASGGNLAGNAKILKHPFIVCVC